MKLAIAASGYKNVVDETAVAFSLDYGPWDSAAWYVTAIEAAIEMLALLTPNDAMMEHIQQFARNSNGKPWITQLTAVAFRTKKVPRLRSSRWFSWLKCAKACLPEWHVRLGVWMFIGIALNMFKDPKDFMVFRKMSQGGGFGAEPVDNVDVPPDLKTLRSKCKSNLYIAAAVTSCEVRYNETVQLLKVETEWWAGRRGASSAVTCVSFLTGIAWDHVECSFLYKVLRLFSCQSSVFHNQPNQFTRTRVSAGLLLAGTAGMATKVMHKRASTRHVLSSGTWHLAVG